LQRRNSKKFLDEAEAARRPKCHNCGEPLEGQTAEVEGKSYHIDCFKCDMCGKDLKPLLGKAMQCLVVNGTPYCEQCGRKAFVSRRNSGSYERPTGGFGAPTENKRATLERRNSSSGKKWEEDLKKMIQEDDQKKQAQKKSEEVSSNRPIPTGPYCKACFEIAETCKEFSSNLFKSNVCKNCSHPKDSHVRMEKSGSSKDLLDDKKAKEEEKQRAKEEEERRKKEEAESKQRAKEEEARKKKDEADAKQRAKEDEARRKKEEADAKQRALQEEEQRKKEETKRAEVEKRRKDEEEK